MKTALMSALVVAAIGCGSKAGDTESPSGRGFGQSHAEGAGPKHDMAGSGEAGKAGEHHGQMPPAVEKFHDTLAPRWHAEHGPKRMADTCGAMAQFHTDGDALAAAAPPSGADAAAWAAGGKRLVESVAALDATCKANDAAAFEPAFARVHHDFHGVMEAAGGHKGGEHKH